MAESLRPGLAVPDSADVRNAYAVDLGDLAPADASGQTHPDAADQFCRQGSVAVALTGNAAPGAALLDHIQGVVRRRPLEEVRRVAAGWHVAAVADAQPRGDIAVDEAPRQSVRGDRLVPPLGLTVAEGADRPRPQP